MAVRTQARKVRSFAEGHQNFDHLV
jgi:hypothetical protein